MNNYLKILLSSLILSITQGMLFPFLPIYAYEVSGKFAYAGYIFSLPSLILVIMTFGWGSISDRLGNRKSVIILSNIVASLLFFLFVHVSITWLIILRCIQTFFYSSYILIPAIITEYYPSTKGRALGKYNVAMGIGWTIGGVLSGHAATIGFSFFFNLIGIFSLLFCFSFFLVRDAPREKDTRSLKEFLNFGDPSQIARLCLYALILMTGSSILSSLFNVHLNNLGVSKQSIGYVTSLTSLTFLLVADATGKACDRFGRKPLLALAALSYLFMWLGIGLIDNLYLKVTLWILPFYAFFITASTSSVSDLTTGKERGRGIGILNSSIGMGNFAGGLLGGQMADILGVPVTFVLSSLFALAGFFITFTMKETRDYE
ncbi:MAG: MFS transporter [Theionarchaea archaeon]|nr:MFS transporter [Theionarchaea archaeon]